MTESGAEVLQRATQAGTGTAPNAYLWAPLPTKLPGSKSAESGVKKCLHLLEVKDLKTDNY